MLKDELSCTMNNFERKGCFLFLEFFLILLFFWLFELLIIEDDSSLYTSYSTQWDSQIRLPIVALSKNSELQREDLTI